MGSPKSKRLGPYKVAVLAGGNSSERTISLASGQAVAKALLSRGHQVSVIDPAHIDVLKSGLREFDIAFLALHGEFGEDGQVQKVLDRLGIRYTGSAAEASKLAFSKSASKERFLHGKVPTPPYILIHESDDIELIERHAQALTYPLVVKPDRQGSSLGVSIIERPKDLPAALEASFQFDAFSLLEKAVLGSEWTVGMLDSQPLPLIQIGTNHKFFDYDAKYEDDSIEYHFEFQLPPAVIKSIEVLARRACRVLNTRGLSRVDLRLDANLQPWVLEVNTIPGFTDHSLVPMAAARMGLDLGELCEQAIVGCLN